MDVAKVMELLETAQNLKLEPQQVFVGQFVFLKKIFEAGSNIIHQNFLLISTTIRYR